MTDPITASALFWKIAPPILTAIGKHGLSSVTKVDFIAKAIESTAHDYPDLEGIIDTLKCLCESDEFKDLLNDIKNGARDLPVDKICSLFMETCGFYLGEETESYALKILVTFASKIEEELLRTDAALSIISKRQEVLHAEARKSVKELGLGIVDGIRSLQYPLPSDDIEKLPEVKEKILHAKIDTARDLINQGKTMTAKKILLELRKEAEALGASPEIYFRVATNIGACSLDAGDHNTAIMEFNEALGYQPDNKKALSNAALAKLLGDKPLEALEFCLKARKLNEKDSHATYVYIQALNQLNREHEIEELVTEESWISEDKICAFVLGDISFKRGHFEKAENCFKRVVEMDPHNGLAYAALALSIFIPLQEMLLSHPPILGILPEEIMFKLREVDELLTHAIDLLKDHEEHNRLHEVYINRAGVRGMLGRSEDALKDCEYVLREDETNKVALHNKGRILLVKNMYTEAIDCFEKALDSCIEIPLSHAYIELARYEEARKLLESLWQSGTDETRHIMVADMLLEVYHKMQEPDKSSELTQLILTKWPNNPDAIAVVAHQRRREDRIGAAIELLNEALTFADEAQKKWINYDIGNLYYKQGEYGEAAKIYDSMVDKTSDNSLLRKYLASLYNSGSYQDALTIARNLRIKNDGQPISFITEIETHVLEYVGDLEAAKELLSKLILIEPEKVMHRLRLAIIYFRAGNYEDARKAVDSVHFDEIKDDAKSLMRIAQVRAYLKMSDVLHFGYRAKRIAPASPEIQSAYLGFFFGPMAASIHIEEPREVEIDSVLYLRRVEVLPDGSVQAHPNPEIRTYTILNEEPHNLGVDELSPSFPLAVKMIGRRKGDVLILKEGPYETLAYEITNIQSKYLQAAQETMNNFSTLFPDNPALHKVEIKDHDLSKIFKSVDEKHTLITDAINSYRDNLIPLGALAHVTGSNIIDVMSGMWSIEKGVIIASSGATEENTRELDLINTAGKIVMDITSLFTLSLLNLLDRLPQRFNTILVCQTVLDDLNELLLTKCSDTKPMMIIGKEGDQYVRQEITREDVEKSRNFLEKMIVFIKTKAEVISSTAVFTFGKEKLEELEQIIGKSSLASISAAKDKKAILYSDDLRLRVFAEREWKVKGIWSQTVLVSLLQKGIITEEEYHKAIVTLALSKYSFISVKAEDIFWLLTQPRIDYSLETKRMFETLHGPLCSGDSAVGVAIALIRQVWLESITLERKLRILDMTLDALTTGRKGLEVLKKFKVGLRIAFKLLPLDLEIVLKNIQTWESQKLLH